MQKVVRLVLAGLLMSFVASGVHAQEPSSAIAVLRDAQGNVVGNALFTTTEKGVRLQVKIANFKSIVTGSQGGQHGIHIHKVGACELPNFSSAGDHFNPTGAAHGLLAPNGSHAGDLDNISIEADGTGGYDVTTDRITLDSGERGIFDEDGSALVIHENADDYMSDPSGNSGTRVACGVIIPNPSR